MSTHEHFDAVIVGSGFGGSVMAFRLAEAGMKVCLLERGKPYPPGSFPRDPAGMKDNFWDPSAGLHGLFNVWSFDHIDSLISAGLGGGSLIYANVLLRKDAEWFREVDHDGNVWEWPLSRADLDPHYDEVERRIGVQRYPVDQAPYDRTFKTLAMRDAAAQLRKDGQDVDWQLAPLAVTFHNDGEAPVPGEPVHEAHRNLHDRTRYTCRLCGECDAGCNYGSKNTMDYTYLSAARRAGAEIRTLADVESFRPAEDGSGYVVVYSDLTLGEKRTDNTPRVTLRCDHLVISAGTFGSSYLMLRNRDALPRLSKTLGSKFCGNGDLLTFALNAKKTDKEGKKVGMELGPSYGPVITSYIRMGDQLDGTGHEGRGFYLEDAGYPSFLNWILETSNRAAMVKRTVKFGWRRVLSILGIQTDSNLSTEVSALLGPCSLSATSVPMLGMGRDVPDGQLGLKGDCLTNSWKIGASAGYFTRLRKTMEAIARQWDAHFFDNPIWWLGKRVITVHPLGGCPMGRDEGEGVVNTWGEVFNYPNLYVADGSVLPGPVGANPALTIAAVSNRFADGIVEKFRGKVQAYKVVEAAADAAPAPAPAGPVS
jgi:cholesterol oxidase